MLIGRIGRGSRKRLGVIGVVAVAALTSVLFFGIQMATAGSSPPAGPKAAAPEAQKSLFREQLIQGGTLFSTGVNLPVPAATFTATNGPVVIKCKGQSCTAIVDATVTAYDGGAGGNFALCPIVDGNFGQCPYVGNLQAGYASRAFKGLFPGLAKGDHVLQMLVYSDNAATLGHWTVQYEMYQDKT